MEVSETHKTNDLYIIHCLPPANHKSMKEKREREKKAFESTY